MKILEGKSTDSLLEILDEIDSITKVDSVVKNGQKISIECIRENGHLKCWGVDADTNMLADSIPFARGNKRDPFLATIDSMDEEAQLFDTMDCYVLCHLNTEAAKNWQGEIVSHWIRISPYQPYTIVGNKPEFEIVKLELSESDYKVMMETKLSFYCKSTDILYPLRTVSFPAVGKLLDCTSAFNRLDEHMLGSALLIAEKLSYQKNGIRFLSRSRGENVRPIISIVGHRYVHFPQKDFFKSALEIVKEQAGIYELGIDDVSKWSVSDEVTTLEIMFKSSHLLEYQPGLIVKTGDIAGTSLSVTAFIKIGKDYVYVKENSALHTGTFDMNKLFEGIFESISQTEEIYNFLSMNKCYFAEGEYTGAIFPILGKRRSQEVKPITAGTYNCFAFYKLLVEATSQHLPKKQYNMLCRLYGEILNQIFERTNELYMKEA